MHRFIGLIRYDGIKNALHGETMQGGKRFGTAVFIGSTTR